MHCMKKMFRIGDVDYQNSTSTGDTGNTPNTGGAGAPAARYGVDSSGKNIFGKVAVIFIVLLVIIAGVAIWQTYSKHTAATVSATDRGYEAISDNQFNIIIDVTRSDPSADTYCIVRALNGSKTEVGRREVFIPGGTNPTIKLTVPIATRERALTGSVYGCGDIIPSYLSTES